MLQTINDTFNNATFRRAFLALRYALFLGLIIVLGATAHIEGFAVAFMVSAFGEAIQLWSFASLVKNQKLTARGPYVLVRNPMYLGRYFVIFGLLMLTGSIWVLSAYTVVYGFYMVNRVHREERRLLALLGDSYRRYCETVNRFLPALSRLTDPQLRFFDFAVLRRNNGHWNLLCMLSAWAAIYLSAGLAR
jgi:protein-S-isoprenylcysteine O-methyltransferase Ste14